MASVPAFAAVGTPVLGVCLGHQAIGLVYGAEVVGAATLMHGKTSEITHQGDGVFAGLPSPLTATRYHSLTLRPDSLPDVLAVTATADDGTIMGVRHRDARCRGRAVPSGEHPHRGRSRPAAQLPRPLFTRRHRLGVTA